MLRQTLSVAVFLVLLGLLTFLPTSFALAERLSTDSVEVPLFKNLGTHHHPISQSQPRNWAPSSYAHTYLSARWTLQRCCLG